MVNLTTIYTKEADGWYTAQVLELQGCVSYGETMEEAERMIKEAAVWYLETQKKIWINIKEPVTKQTFISSIPVSYETV